MKFTIKKMCILFLFLVSVGYPICADEKTNDEQSVFIDLSRNNSFYNEMRKHYDKIELRYVRGEDYANGYGKKYFILQRLSYYGIKGNDEYLLGYVTIDGIYDKNSNLLKKVVVPEYTINIGLSSGTLNAPWEPSYALKDTRRKNEIGNTNPFAFLRINFSNNTLEIYQPEY